MFLSFRVLRPSVQGLRIRKARYRRREL